MSGENVTFAHLNAQDFEHFIETSKSPAVVFFHKNTCGPCRAFHTVFESIAAKWHRQIAFYKFDAMTSPEIAQENVGYTFPTVVIFDQGVLFAKHIGATSSEHFDFFMKRQWDLLQKKKAMQVNRPPLYGRQTKTN